MKNICWMLKYHQLASGQVFCHPLPWPCLRTPAIHTHVQWTCILLILRMQKNVPLESGNICKSWRSESCVGLCYSFLEGKWVCVSIVGIFPFAFRALKIMNSVWFNVRRSLKHLITLLRVEIRELLCDLFHNSPCLVGKETIAFLWIWGFRYNVLVL